MNRYLHSAGGHVTPNSNQLRDGTGYRVITYFAGRDLPVFLLTVYAKGERANLSPAERNTLRSILSGIAASYRGRAKR
ncbi:hypothetical protein [Elioraea sp.]|uniref:hypothetical protein n=1 Tax=Elioraea sp. TaxID=2185103 RepID=UPI00307E0569